MADRFGAPMIVLAAVAFSLIAGAQNAPRINSGATAEQQATPHPGPVLLDGWGRPVTDALKPGEKPGPAPRHDISGIWEPARGPGDGIQANGPRVTVEPVKNGNPAGRVLQVVLPNGQTLGMAYLRTGQEH